MKYRYPDLYLETIEQIQWAEEKKYAARNIQKAATYKIVSAAVISLVLFLVPYLIMFIFVYFDKHQHISTWYALPLWTALSAGLFGAFFSRLLYLQGHWNTLSLAELKDAKQSVSIFLRGVVGMAGAAVVFFFLQSHIVSGSLLPNLNEIGLVHDPKKGSAGIIQLPVLFPNAQLALLVAWSFLAGFSERVVTSILSSTEGSITASPNPPTIRK